jgi:hypothetical protein
MATQTVYSPGSTYEEDKFRFYTFFHPYVCDYLEALAKERDVADLFDLAIQSRSLDKVGIIPPNLFQVVYQPSSEVDDRAYPSYDVDFDYAGAYALYNWELFFHIPLYIATRLMQEQHHEEAMRWFHYIFNPTTSDTGPIPNRYWFFKPFRDANIPQGIQDILLTLQETEAPQEEKTKIGKLIEDWRDNPFEPHRIARGRLGAYQKTVVMKYRDNLIELGDKLFRLDTIESINEAMQYYILAARIAPRSQKVTPPATPVAEKLTYGSLRSKLDAFANAAVENLIVNPIYTFPEEGTGKDTGASTLFGLPSLAFCMPPNDRFQSQWETIEDRLFKIRNCMNIEGVVRELALFEPPIDPALLVRARAMGLDLSSVLDDLYAPLPNYRFTFILQKAREFCEELKQLGGLLLSTLEKKDAEELAQIRSTQEKEILKAVLEIKKKQVKEADENVASLERAQESAETRKLHYETISSRLAGEKLYLDKQVEAVVWQVASQMAALTGSMGAGIPDVTYVARMGPWSSAVGSDMKMGGGSSIASIANLVSTYLGWLGQIASLEGTTASYKAGLTRSQQDRDLQIQLATHEIKQIGKQLAAAKIRKEIAENEVHNHEKQIEQAEVIEDFLRQKFTNQELYNWMKSQVSKVYSQAHKLAYDLAKRAERSYRHELGIEDSNIIQFGSWDNLRKGLLAGEKLSLGLRRLENAYLENNRREYEITKNVSLLTHAPVPLIELKETGQCEVELPELLFDADYPGHYFRRLKSVSLSIPAVVGPYTSINCTLTLLKSQVRIDPKAPGTMVDYPEKTAGADVDKRFTSQWGSIQSVAASHGQNDSGLFELNFRDERYLPFEGAGAISRWRIDLPKETNAFDLDTVSDVILTLRYTARDAGQPLRQAALAWLKDVRTKVAANGDAPLQRLFSVRHEFANEWHNFRATEPEKSAELTLVVDRERFPYIFQGMDITITGIAVYARPVEGAKLPEQLTVTPPGSPALALSGTFDSSFTRYGSLPPSQSTGVPQPLNLALNQFINWTISGFSGKEVKALEDLVIVLGYTAKTKK